MTVEVDGYCECNTDGNWLTGADQCICDGYVNTRTHDCLKCNDIYPSCSHCFMSDEINKGYHYVGKSQYNPDQLDYVVCEDCGEGQYLEISSLSCQECSQFNSGCLQCDYYGEECTDCENGYFLDKSSSTCLTCDNYIAHCDLCAPLSDYFDYPNCHECKNGFTLFLNTCF